MTYLDTAPRYGLGDSERRFGRGLRGADRDAYVLSTEVGRLVVAPELGLGARELAYHGSGQSPGAKLDFSGDGIRRSLEDRLVRLGLERFDIVYLSDPADHRAAGLLAAGAPGPG